MLTATSLQLRRAKLELRATVCERLSAAEGHFDGLLDAQAAAHTRSLEAAHTKLARARSAIGDAAVGWSDHMLLRSCWLSLRLAVSEGRSARERCQWREMVQQLVEAERRGSLRSELYSEVSAGIAMGMAATEDSGCEGNISWPAPLGESLSAVPTMPRRDIGRGIEEARAQATDVEASTAPWLLQHLLKPLLFS